MAKTRLEWLENELVELEDILLSQFIERDIAVLMQDQEEVSAIHEEINRYIRRREIILQLIDLEKHGSNSSETNFRATIHINNENFQSHWRR